MNKCKNYVNKLLTSGWVLLIFSLLVVSESSNAQNTIGTQLLGASGGTYYSGNVGLTFSLGETIIDQTSQATFGLLQNDPQGTPTVTVRDIDAAAAALVLFPNPNQGEFQLNNVPAGSTHWQVYDLTGRIIETELLSNEPIRLKAFLSQGIYLLRLVDEAGIPTGDRKFSIIR